MWAICLMRSGEEMTEGVTKTDLIQIIAFLCKELGWIDSGDENSIDALDPSPDKGETLIETKPIVKEEFTVQTLNYENDHIDVKNAQESESKNEMSRKPLRKIPKDENRMFKSVGVSNL